MAAGSRHQFTQPLLDILTLVADGDVHASLPLRVRRRRIRATDEQMLGEVNPAFRTRVMKSAQRRQSANESTTTRCCALGCTIDAFDAYTVGHDNGGQVALGTLLAQRIGVDVDPEDDAPAEVADLGGLREHVGQAEFAACVNVLDHLAHVFALLPRVSVSADLRE